MTITLAPLLMSWAAFQAAHAGSPAAGLSVSATWHPAHGVVLHDGVCAYSEAAELGCFDPMQGGNGSDLSCADPAIRLNGVAWLHLHGAAFVPFQADAPTQTVTLPLWVFSQVTDEVDDSLLLWGHGYTKPGSSTPAYDGQELWEWHPEGILPPRRLAIGPREQSGGIARWPDETGCFALATYAMVDAPCEGTTTVWKWCRAEPEEFAAAAQFRGCSSRILATRRDDRVEIWNVDADRATIYPAFTPPTDAPSVVTAAPDQLALVTLTGEGSGVARVRWNGESVSVESVRVERP